MPPFLFQSIPAQKTQDLSSLLQQVNAGRMNGFAIAHLSSLEQVYVLFREGKMIHGYRASGQGAERIPARDVDDFGSWGFSFYPIPPRALQFLRVLLENPFAEVSGTRPVDEILTLPQQFRHEPTATLLHVRLNHADALICVAGGNLPFEQVILLSDEAVFEGPEALRVMGALPDVQAQVTVYRGGLEQPAWRELHLTVLFEWASGSILERYGYLTGRTMVASVTRDMAVQAARKGWDVDAAGNTVRCNTLFVTPTEMTETYVSLVRVMLGHIQSVVGVGMMTIILRQTSGFLNENYRSLAQEYQFFD